jgi:hypothetical protein
LTTLPSAITNAVTEDKSDYTSEDKMSRPSANLGAYGHGHNGQGRSDVSIDPSAHTEPVEAHNDSAPTLGSSFSSSPESFSADPLFSRYRPAKPYAGPQSLQPDALEDDMRNAWDGHSAQYDHLQGGDVDDIDQALVNGLSSHAEQDHQQSASVHHDAQAAAPTGLDPTSQDFQSSSSDVGLEQNRTTATFNQDAPDSSHYQGSSFDADVVGRGIESEGRSSNHTATPGLTVEPRHAAHPPFHLLFPGLDPAFWAFMACERGLSPHPSQVFVQDSANPSGQALPVWLPRQGDFNDWHATDVQAFKWRIDRIVAGVNWDGLDAYEVPDQHHIGQTQAPQSVRDEQVQTPQSQSRHIQQDQSRAFAQDLSGDQQIPPRFEQPLAQLQVAAQYPPVDSFASDQPAASEDGSSSHQVQEVQQDQDDETQPTDALLSDELADTLDDLVDSFRSTSSRRTFRQTHDVTWQPPQADDTIPEGKRGESVHVKRLLRAMNTMATATDSVDNNSFKVRWLPRDAGDPFYSKEKMAIRCWDIVKLTVKLHTIGPSALNCFDHVYAKKFKDTRDWTFQERMDRIVQLLAARKSRCDSVMKGENLDALVGAPESMAKSSVTNGVNNNKKAAEIKRGKEVLKQEAANTESQAANSTASDDLPIGVNNVGQAGSSGSGRKRERPDDDDHSSNLPVSPKRARHESQVISQKRDMPPVPRTRSGGHPNFGRGIDYSQLHDSSAAPDFLSGSTPTFAMVQNSPYVQLADPDLAINRGALPPAPTNLPNFSQQAGPQPSVPPRNQSPVNSTQPSSRLGKRRAADAKLEDENPRIKSPRTTERQVHPARRRRSPEHST